MDWRNLIKYTDLVKDNNATDLKSIIDTNLLGVGLCRREAFHLMRKRQFSGHIILINSIVGHVVPNFGPKLPSFNIEVWCHCYDRNISPRVLKIWNKNKNHSMYETMTCFSHAHGIKLKQLVCNNEFNLIAECKPWRYSYWSFSQRIR